ncbi:universal stress protein [Streptomyces capillispiralis]|uniref:Nucleotide-binding universal stress UspA family protein n=1 Tax=Streptomyces capillispiralis TaxID=68182 RepID=A0A561TQZ6_9ACTN|nr:universal stress protein [Streptomyces capillispiralis]TWF89530.1 nucleotide-binding universal stress UspA family protein [Streptomyces capillispiralis]GHH93493.1 universal stress protein [Streptomyces capillispiralis]
MTRPITAGIDGTGESLAALAWAAREAVRRGLPLRVVHAWRFEAHDAVDGVDTGDRATQERWVREAAGEAVRAVRERHPDLPVAVDVLEGDAVDTLTGVAAEAEMLVLGSRGHGRILGFLVGSVGQQVIVDAERPVVFVRAGDRPSHEVAGHEIVVGQQGGPQDSAAALGFAFETAARRGATVRAVRAWTLPPVFAYSPASLQLLDEAGGLEPYERKGLAAALAPWRERYPDVHVVEHVEMGSAGQVLLSVAGTAQLMVVGRRAHRTAVGARIGSVAHGVLHHADCPVAVVPPA